MKRRDALDVLRGLTIILMNITPGSREFHGSWPSVVDRAGAVTGLALFSELV